MSLRYLTMRTALGASTQNTATTNFNHLRSIPRAWLIRRTKHDPKLKSVRPQDRIKWWNIVPGDQIRLRGDREGTIHEVLSINRLSNRVFLKNTSPASSPNSNPPPTKNYHYSRCQLYVGEYIAYAKKTDDGTKLQPVYASRIGTSEPHWSYLRNRFVWKRYAVATTPKLIDSASGVKIHIPWPPAVKRTYPSARPYDTTQEALEKITYQPPAFRPSLLAPLPPLPAEKEYLDLIYKDYQSDVSPAYDPSAPYEVYLKPDLANPHSRAKKLQRFKLRQSIIHAQLKDITDFELKHHEGRTEKQIRSDAAFRWRELVKSQQAERKKVRWMHSARVQSLEKKSASKSKKEDRQRRRLTELLLGEEENQVLPANLKARNDERKNSLLKA